MAIYDSIGGTCQPQPTTGSPERCQDPRSARRLPASHGSPVGPSQRPGSTLRPVYLGFGAIALAAQVSTTYVSIMDSTPSDPKRMPRLRVVRFLEHHPATGGCGLVVVGLGVVS